MTYPNSSPIRRSSRRTRGFQPGNANDNAMNDNPGVNDILDEVFGDAPRYESFNSGADRYPYEDHVLERRAPLPDNDPRDRSKLIKYHLRRGGNLLRGFAGAGAFGVGYGVGSTIYEIYRQRNASGLPEPMPPSGGWAHQWDCPQNYGGNYRFKFWRAYATWNDTIKCLTAQAQFRTAASVTVEGTPGTGYYYPGDGKFITTFANSTMYHFQLWANYCVGTGCATDRSNELAHRAGPMTAGSPVRYYAGSPWWFPATVPVANPAVNPHALPINLPVTVPRPMPYRSVPYMPVFDPYAPGTTPLRGPLPTRAISPSPWRNGIVVRPNAPPTPAPPHVRRPPVKGEKERKPGRDVKRAIDPIVGPITEAVDAIDAVYDALPWSVRKQAYRKCRAGGGQPRECMTPQKKLKVIYDNAHRLDMAKVVENLAKNHLEDRLIGELSRRADKNLRDRGWHDRFGRGPTAGPAI